MSAPVMIVDGDSLAHRAYHALPKSIRLNAVVGFAGVRATLWTLEHGVTLALANKESLVAAGDLALRAHAQGGGLLLRPL